MKRLELLAALLVAGCNGSAAEPDRPLCERARALRSTPGLMTVAEEADLAARVLPGGFGGLFQEIAPNSDGVLVAYFKDPTKTGVKTSLHTLLLCGAVYPGWAGVFVVTDFNAIAIRQGKYDATELLSYRRALEPLKSDPVVWGLEIDPESNRVWLGITDPSQLTRIQQAVANRAVPATAVSIEVPPPTT